MDLTQTYILEKTNKQILQIKHMIGFTITKINTINMMKCSDCTTLFPINIHL